MNVSATALKNRLGTYLEAAVKEPVIVEKTGRPAAVIVSYEHFQELEHLEDAYWGMRAKQADKEGYLSAKESMKFLTED